MWWILFELPKGDYLDKYNIHYYKDNFFSPKFIFLLLISSIHTHQGFCFPVITYTLLSFQPSSNHFAPVQASLASCTQSEVSTSGGSPPDDDIPQDQADLELNQVHGEAEPQNRHTSHLSRFADSSY